MLLTLACGLLALTLMGFFGSNDWFLDICSSFRVQYVYVALIVGIAALCRCNRKAATVAGLALITNLAFVLPYYFPLSQLEQKPESNQSQSSQLKATVPPSLKDQPTNTYTLLHSNVLKNNRQRGRVLSLIQRTHADIVVLAEVNKSWSEILRHNPQLIKMYPYQFYDDYDYDLMILSKFKLVNLKKQRQIGLNVIPPILRTQIELPARTISLIQIHADHATSDDEAVLQRLLIDQVIADRKTIIDPLLVVGDYNMTPWAYQFRRLESEAHLSDAARGFGIQPTWPNGLGPLMIPIDHLMISPDVQIQDIKPLAPVGSDHLPIYAKFSLTPR
jgi:endonuclease/exonuclease/phosphatase (EEP) superfamily protein YafD